MNMKKIIIYASAIILSLIIGAFASYKIYNTIIEIRVIAYMNQAEEYMENDSLENAFYTAIKAQGLNEQTNIRLVPYIYEFLGRSSYLLGKYDYAEYYFENLMILCKEKWKEKIDKEYFGYFYNISCHPEFLYRSNYAYVLEKIGKTEKSEQQYKLAFKSYKEFREKVKNSSDCDTYGIRENQIKEECDENLQNGFKNINDLKNFMKKIFREK